MESYQLSESIRLTAGLLSWDEDQVRSKWKHLLTLTPQQLSALNPLDSDLGWDEEDSLSFFIAGTRTGLFQSRWSVACTTCGTLVENQEALHHFTADNYACPLCGSQVPVDLDLTVEVTFYPATPYYRLGMNPYDGDRGHYEGHFQSHRYLCPPLVREFLQKHKDNFALLGLWEFGKIPFRLQAGETLRVVNMETQSALVVQAEELPPPKGSFLNKMIHHQETTGEKRPIQTIESDLKDDGFTQRELLVKSGRIELWVHNQTQKPVGLQVFRHQPEELQDLALKNPPHPKSHLTGKRLISNQSFRDLLLVEGLPDDFRLPIHRLSLLFTNLKDSVQLYQVLGDNKAYGHIQSHYQQVSAHLKACHGAMVKTMGDQVMAVFSRPQDAFQAADKILKACKNTLTEDGKPLEIRFALHDASVLAVKANRTLDFFGAAVNKCALLLNHSEAGDIRTTSAFMDTPGTTKIASGLGYNCVQQNTKLDGAEEEIVYVCRAGERG